MDSHEPLLLGTGFARDAVDAPAPTTFYDVRGSLLLYGSHAGNESATGSASTRWYQATPVFYLFIAGTPNIPGEHLAVEVKTAKSGIVQLPVAPFENPGNRWLLKRISLNQVRGAEAFRIVAVDGSATPGVWLGFSQPFLDTRTAWPWLLKQTFLILLTAAAAVVGLLSPGLILRQKAPALSPIWIPAPGLLLFALIGVAAWVAPHVFGSPALICRACLGLVILAATYEFVRYPLSSFTRPAERKALLVLLVLTALAIGKSMYSLGPVGELFHDEISRTLAVGPLSDSRHPYFIPELIATRSAPYGPLAKELYETWNFSDRGPMAGLAATPIVLSGPVSILAQKPEEVWTLFDERGFMAYRIAMIVMAAMTVPFVFGLARVFLSEEWALIAALVTMGSPFVIHDIYYTWPKLVAAGFVLLGAYLVWESRMFLAGLALGIGYLFHSSALLFAPALVGMLILSQRGKIRRWVAGTAWLIAGGAVCPIFWRVFNQGHYTQGRFLFFLIYSGEHWPPTVSQWLHYRLDSVLNTLVPLNVVLFHASHPNLNAFEGASPAVVHFFLQPWCSVPFAAGIVFFFCLLRLMYVGVRKAPWWVLLVFAIPFLLFTAFTGIDNSGLLKEGLHAWFLGLMTFSVVMWSRFEGSQTFWKICNWALAARGIEVLLMMLLPAMWTRHAVVERPFVGTDVLALFVMLGATAWLYGYAFARIREMGRAVNCPPAR
ncbi:MAG TPA: hypothetical protein VFB14_08590 [Bryobacteraceae bacterium]|nr:hypothetical protein [Bryobacteraceae bacterium]